MENIDIKIDGDTLIITVDLSHNAGISKSGKSITIASSRGNISIPGTDAKMGLNIYRSRQ